MHFCSRWLFRAAAGESCQHGHYTAGPARTGRFWTEWRQIRLGLTRQGQPRRGGYFLKLGE